MHHATRTRTRTLLAFCLAAAAASSATAGVVEVSFIEPARFTDTGAMLWERQSNLNALAAYLQSLGQRLLPADQTLKIEVLDVDLAGDVRPFPRAGRVLRVVRGRADWPRIQLRYTLTADGKTLLSGEEKVADLNYMQGLDTSHGSEPLYYEKRMLEGWFKARLVERRAD